MVAEVASQGPGWWRAIPEPGTERTDQPRFPLGRSDGRVCAMPGGTSGPRSASSEKPMKPPALERRGGHHGGTRKDRDGNFDSL